MHRNLSAKAFEVSPGLDRARITELGLAIPKEKARREKPAGDAWVGNLPYLPPEQTGRTSRPVDQRSDLYSLGILFYQLLSGQLPFEGSDPLEMIYAHIAKTPRPLGELRPGLPEPLVRIVSKLLCKSAEDRYQSASGLRADLEHCLRQWEAQGAIPIFDIGGSDLPDTFAVPERLYGRSEEVEALQSAFERAATSGKPVCALVSGESGMGKSSLVLELRHPVRKRRGFLAVGKAEQFRAEIPYAPVSTAFGSIVHRLLGESDASLSKWRSRLLSVLGSSAGVLIEVIPDLQLLIGPQPKPPRLPPAEAESRFNLAFLKLVSAFSTAEHPLALFLDDLQWADPGTLRLLGLAVSQTSGLHLMVVGAYRSNEVGDQHPLRQVLDQLRARQSNELVQVHLGPLSRSDVETLLQAALRLPAREVSDLGDAVLAKTAGNPFFITQFLLTLSERNCLRASREAGRWVWDLERIRALEITDNVVDLLSRRVQELRPDTRRALQAAACMGSVFQLDILSATMSMDANETARCLQEAFDEGLILALADTRPAARERRSPAAYGAASREKARFAHDRIRQAVHQTMDAANRRRLHVRIGRVLLDRLGERRNAEHLFDAVAHLNEALPEILQGRALDAETPDSLELARLNLQAAENAMISNAYGTALTHVCHGWSLISLDGDPWTRERGLAMAFHQLHAECRYMTGDFASAHRLVSEGLLRSASLDEKASLYRIRMKAQESAGQFSSVVETAREALALFEVSIPERPERLKAAARDEFARFKSLVGSKPVRDRFKGLPELRDPSAKLVMGLLSDLVITGFFTDFDLFALVSNKMVNLTLERGFSSESAYGVALFSPIPRLYFGEDVSTTVELGEIALSLIDSVSQSAHLARIFLLYPTWIAYWTRPIESTLTFFERGITAGIESGDAIWASYNAVTRARYEYWRGTRLDKVDASCLYGEELSSQLNVALMVAYLRLYRRRVVELRMGEEPGSETAKLAEEARKLFEESGYSHGLGASALCDANVHFVYRRYREALSSLDETERHLPNIALGVDLIEFRFLQSLVLASLHGEADPEERKRFDSILRDNAALLGRLEGMNRENFLHKSLLIQAELARLGAEDGRAAELYSRAAREAELAGYLQNQAIAHELAGRFHAQAGRRTKSRRELHAAARAYSNWGATAKARQLEDELGDPAPVAAARAEASPQSLDLLTALKATQAISSEIKLSRLTQKLLEVVMENAGARKGALLLMKRGALALEALSEKGPGPKAAGPASVPESVIQYVRRSRRSLVLDHPAERGNHMDDPYVAARRPQCILCFPIVRQAELLGVIYLENDLLPGSLSASQVALLEMIATQAAISLENATLYAEMEERVEQRTRELMQAQQQMLFSAKMSSLGEMAAGIAHEINNPLAIIQLAASSLQSSRVARKSEEQVGRMVDRIATTTNRIARIIHGLRAFAREGDQDPIQVVPVNRIIEETLVFCRERLVTHGVTLDCAPVPPEIEIECRSIQISQILLNLLNNAFDAVCDLEEKWIRIDVEQRPSEVRISVTDSGHGIAPEARAKLFQPFFTTKEIGKGTGLGLSIAHGIARSHGGDLFVDESSSRTRFVLALPRKQG